MNSMIEPNDLYNEYSCKPLQDNQEDWNIALDCIGVYDQSYMPYSIKFQAQYFTEKYEYYQDYSMVYYNSENRPVGVWPLCVYKQNGKNFVGANGGMCVFPLIIDSLHDTKTKKKMDISYFRMLKFLCERYKISEIEFEVNPFLYNPDSLYKQLVYSGAFISYFRNNLYVNLQHGIDYTLKKIRRLGKAKINKAKKELKCEIIDRSSTDITEAFEKFRMLHITVAGRETRSKETWEIQELGLRSSDDFIVFLRDSSDELVGASLWSSTPLITTLSVAAYKRDLFDKYALGHISHIYATEHAYRLGKKWLYLGAMPLPADIPTPTEKEITIGMFKKHFATDVAIVSKIRVDLDVLQKY